MLKRVTRIFRRNMFDLLEPSQINAETFFLSFRTAQYHSERQQAVLDYLTQYYSNGQPQKAKDFPTNSEWINTEKPLSIQRDLKGKIVLLDFFTYCCINCMHILPDLKTLENKYSVEDGLVVIGVHCAKFTNEKQTGSIVSAVKRYGIAHAVINDSKGTIWEDLKVSCWPSLIVLGPSGEILLTVRGEGHLELLDCFIDVALKFTKERLTLSDHSLPQIKVTDELTSFGPLAFPGKVVVFEEDQDSLVAVSDSGHNRILVLNKNGNVKHVIGGVEAGFKDGDFTTSRFYSPQGIAFRDRNTLYVADTENHAIREIDLEKKSVKTVAGTGKQGMDRVGGRLWTAQELSSPWDVCFGKDKNVLIIAMAGNHQMWALYLSEGEQNIYKKGKSGECWCIAGSGKEENRNNCYPQNAGFAQPSGLAYCPERNSVYIADSESSSVRELHLSDGKVSAVVGGNKHPLNLFAFGDEDGCGYDAKLQHALGVAWDENKKKLYVADSYNHKIKMVDVLKNNQCITVDLSTKLNEPAGLYVFKDEILIADTNNHCIKIYNTTDSTVSLLPVTLPNSKKAEKVTEEKTIDIGKEGGKVDFSLKVKKSDKISFTKNAPSYWSITIVDESLKAGKIREIREDMRTETKLSVELPKSLQEEKKPAVKIFIKGTLYICRDSVCAFEKIYYIVKVNYSDKEDSKRSFCEFSYTVPE